MMPVKSLGTDGNRQQSVVLVAAIVLVFSADACRHYCRWTTTTSVITRSLQTQMRSFDEMLDLSHRQLMAPFQFFGK